MIPAKVCPRCGAQYETLKSTTCPQCFARLLVVDDATAEELKAARDEVERTPEFQAAKTEDDERFREQSFGACLGVIVITLITVIVAIVLIASAVHRQRHPIPLALQTASATQPQATIGSLDLLTPLPVAAASLDDVLPATVGPYQRTKQDQGITLSGTLTPLFHAAYTGSGATIQTYAIPASLPTPQQNQFRQGVELAAQIESAPMQTFATEHWRYAAIGPTNRSQNTPSLLDGFRQALGAHFRQLSR